MSRLSISPQRAWSNVKVARSRLIQEHQVKESKKMWQFHVTFVHFTVGCSVLETQNQRVFHSSGKLNYTQSLTLYQWIICAKDLNIERKTFRREAIILKQYLLAYWHHTGRALPVREAVGGKTAAVCSAKISQSVIITWNKFTAERWTERFGIGTDIRVGVIWTIWLDHHSWCKHCKGGRLQRLPETAQAY